MVERKYDTRWVTSITFEKSVFDRVAELLPKGVTIPDIVNEMLKHRLLDLEREQKVKNGLLDKSAIRISEVAQKKDDDTFNYILQSHDDEILEALRMLPLEKREKVVNKLQRNYMRSIYEEQNDKQKDNEIVEAEHLTALTEEEYKLVQKFANPSLECPPEIIELRQRLRQYGKVR